MRPLGLGAFSAPLLPKKLSQFVEEELFNGL